MPEDAVNSTADGRYRLNEPAVVADVIDSETIIMNLESGDYYSLNGSGGELWLLLLAGLRRDELLATIAERHGVKPPTAEVDGFIGRLVEHRLIVPADRMGTDARPADLAAPASGAESWRRPEISVYADMKDLLAMDPPMPLPRSNGG